MAWKYEGVIHTGLVLCVVEETCVVVLPDDEHEDTQRLSLQEDVFEELEEYVDLLRGEDSTAQRSISPKFVSSSSYFSTARTFLTFPRPPPILPTRTPLRC